MFTRFCESRRRFSSLLSLKYISYLFSVCLISPCSLPAAVLLLVPLLRSPGAWPSVSLSPPSLPAFPLLVLPLLLLYVPWLPCRLSSLHRARPEALRRPAVLSPLSGCPLVAAVTRPSSGAKRYGSVGRCSVYMSPA